VSLTDTQIRGAIESWLDDTHESSNEVYLAHRAGIFRGLIQALTGLDPGSYLTADTGKLCELAGIPYHIAKSGHIHYGEDIQPAETRCALCIAATYRVTVSEFVDIDGELVRRLP